MQTKYLEERAWGDIKLPPDAEVLSLISAGPTARIFGISSVCNLFVNSSSL